MAIIRHKLNDYQHGEAVPTERKPEDFDIGWGEQRIYVLDEHEWWNPHTSSKYEDRGISRHAMFGPAVIVCSPNSCGMVTSHEYHVNDPRAWSYVRRCIEEGFAAPGKMPVGPSHDETLVTIRSAEENVT